MTKKNAIKGRTKNFPNHLFILKLFGPFYKMNSLIFYPQVKVFSPMKKIHNFHRFDLKPKVCIFLNNFTFSLESKLITKILAFYNKFTKTIFR